LVGIFFVLLSLGGIALHVVNGGTREFKNRKFIASMHGIGLLVSFVAGFGLLAKLGFMRDLPTWSIMKMVIWLVLGGLPAVIYRKPTLAKPIWLTTLVLAGFAAYLAVYKPFMSVPATTEGALESQAPPIGTTVPTAPPPAEPATNPATGQ
jgi:hypothetical protein